MVRPNVASRFTTMTADDLNAAVCRCQWVRRWGGDEARAAKAAHHYFDGTEPQSIGFVERLTADSCHTHRVSKSAE